MSRPLFPALRASLPLACGILALACGGCAPRETARPAVPPPLLPPAPVADPAYAFTATAIGNPIEGRPWITYLTLVDLDQDGAIDVLACDARDNTVRWLRQVAPLQFTESVLGAPIPAPAHVEACDYDNDGDLDVLVASMGQILPNNDPIGAVVVLENDGAQRFSPRTVLADVARVTDVRGADLDGDTDIDLIVGQFGYVQGEINILRNDGTQHYTAERLLSLPGTINTPVADFDGDRRPDVAALVSQEWEEVHLFDNTGGSLRPRQVWGSTNEDFGSSGLTVADLDRDGDPDLLLTNGDAFDYARPGSRPWHGLQWLENQRGNFTYHRIGGFPGAFSPVAVDLDGDRDLDIVTVSGFNDWESGEAVSLLAWVNDGAQQFRPVILARSPTHLITVAAAALDGDGRVELITGGFHAYPPWNDLSRLLLWRR